MSKPDPVPMIGVPADVRLIEGSPFHAVGDKYVRAIMLASEAVPFIVPAFGELHDVPALVQRLDGLLLTGSPSNVHPSRYGATATPEAEPHDPERDETTLPMIREALDQGVPLLAICRGFQELNVALGGTLHARVHELPGRHDHRALKVEDLDVKYGPRHPVTLTPGGAFERLAGSREITVNSLHWQAIDRLAEGLAVEAVAPDGTIEAVSVKEARGFALGVQWHPEYRVLNDAFSVALFAAFGVAARARAQRRAEGRLSAPVLEHDTAARPLAAPGRS
jgi:putative glutamine amidotransferase